MNRADEESRLSPPFSYESINRLHDVAEMFLVLVAEHLHADIPANTRFLGYWDPIGKKLKPPLGYKVQMKRVNSARVAFKHHSNDPTVRTLEDARNAVRGLIHDETPRVFGVELDAISMASFITSDRARELVESAESRWAAREHLPEEEYATAHAFADLSQALDIVISNYGQQPGAWHRENVFGTPEQPPRLYSDALRQLRAAGHGRDDVARSVLEALQPCERALATWLSALELSSTAGDAAEDGHYRGPRPGGRR